MSSHKATIAHPTPSHAPPVLTNKLRDNLFAALWEADSVRNIQRTLEEELAVSGWTSNLRDYIMRLLRSGECTTFDQVMKRVEEKVANDASSKNGVNGATNGDAAVHDLKIPEKAIKEGSKAVKAELEKTCEIKYEDED